MTSTLRSLSAAAAARLATDELFTGFDIQIVTIPWLSTRRTGIFWQSHGTAARSSWQLPRGQELEVRAAPATVLAIGYERVVHDCPTCATDAWMKIIAWQSIIAAEAATPLEAYLEKAFALLNEYTLEGAAGACLPKEIRAGTVDELPLPGEQAANYAIMALTLNVPLALG